MNTLKIAKVRDVKTPTRGTSNSAGLDFYVPNDFNGGQDFLLAPGNDILIPSGIKAKIPDNCMLMGANKSGIATSLSAMLRIEHNVKNDKLNCSLIVGANIVDEDYQGELYLHVLNIGPAFALIKPGMKLEQFILVPVYYPEIKLVNEDELFTEVTERGTGAFGSTNKI